MCHCRKTLSLSDKLKRYKETIEKEQKKAKCDPKDERHVRLGGSISSGDFNFPAAFTGSLTPAFVTFGTTKEAYQVLKGFRERKSVSKMLTGPHVKRVRSAASLFIQSSKKITRKLTTRRPGQKTL